MNILDVHQSVKAHKRRKRCGRGAASGLGKTSGRGQKGMGARSGANFLRGFVGGQTPLRQRFAKRGFNNAIFRVEYVPINLDLLESSFEGGAVVGPEELRAKGVTLRRGELIKILGRGELTKKLTVRAHAFSHSAREKIEKAGGKVEILENHV